MIDYSPLRITLAKKAITKSKMREDIGMSMTTLAKFSKNDYVSMEIIDKICTYLDCNIEDVVQHVKDK